MSWLLQGAIGICMIIICGGLVAVAIEYFEKAQPKHKKKLQSEDKIAQRLDEIDRRLTDVQDVMIALTEKMDRMEERERI